MRDGVRPVSGRSKFAKQAVAAAPTTVTGCAGDRGAPLSLGVFMIVAFVRSRPSFSKRITISPSGKQKHSCIEVLKRVAT